MKLTIIVVLVAVVALLSVGMLKKEYNFQATVSTTASLEDSFTYATSVEKRSDWISSVKSATLSDEGAVVIGSKFEEETDTGNMTLQIKELELNKKLRYETIVGSGVFLDVVWLLEDKNDGTNIDLSITFYPKGGFKFLLPLVYPLVIEPGLEEDMKSLTAELNKI